MPRVALLRTYTQWDETYGCDYAVVNLSRRSFNEYEQIVENIPLSGDYNNAFLSVTFWDTLMVVSFPSLERVMSKAQMTEVDIADEIVIMNLTEDQLDTLEASEESIECVELHAYRDGVYWTFSPKHTNIECSTYRLGYHEE